MKTSLNVVTLVSEEVCLSLSWVFLSFLALADCTLSLTTALAWEVQPSCWPPSSSLLCRWDVLSWECWLPTILLLGTPMSQKPEQSSLDAARLLFSSWGKRSERMFLCALPWLPNKTMEVAPWLRTYTALAKDRKLVPSTHVGAHNSQKLELHLEPVPPAPRVPAFMCTHPCKDSHTRTNLKIMIKKVWK